MVFRFIGINWDQNFHLHPDERFLTMVGNAMRIPVSFWEYLDPAKSPMNPHNIGFSFYVYGIFPVMLNKVLAVFIGNDTYNAFAVQGRVLAGLFDTFSVVMVYLVACHFEIRNGLHKNVKYVAALLYAITVLPIQLSHFFTVDPFLNFFILASFYCALRSRLILLSAVFFGFAVASKISAIFAVPLVGFVLMHTHLKDKKILLHLLSFAVVGYLTLRVADPYIFQTSNFLNPTISQTFISNLEQLRALDNPNALFPPGVQWIHTEPVIYAGFNLALFGLGIPYVLLLLWGYVVIFRKHLKSVLGFICGWTIIYFLYQSVQFSKPMRYLYMLYPFYGLIAGIGFSDFARRVSKPVRKIVLGLVFIWPVAFISIYIYTHPRVSASEWIFKNIPESAVILSEHWDDALPLPLKPNSYRIEQLPVFAPDTPEKVATVETMMRSADYYILSSNRGWGSITKAPERYPFMAPLYEKLLHNKTEYQLVKVFESYPSFRYLGIPIEFPDGSADESFTVYDHPVVMIFKNIKPSGK